MHAPSLAQLAERYDLDLVGDGQITIQGVCGLKPGLAGHLAFAGATFREAARATAAAAVIVPAELADAIDNGLVASNPQLAFARIAAEFAPDDRPLVGVHASATVDPGAQLGDGVRIGAHCVIEAGVRIADGCALGPGCVIGQDATIGADSDLAARVVVGARVQIGARALILPGAVIGSRGFGNAHDGKRWHAIPQLGTVRVGNDVEIGANTCIDRGALADTVIGDNARIDNLCQIAHNVQIGPRTALASGVGIAGSTQVGADCMLGGQVGVSGHLRIADRVIVNGGAKVLQSIDEPGQYASGMPLLPVMGWRRLMVVLAKLEPRLKKLERKQRHGD